MLGIEAKRFDAGAGLSPEVERSVARLVDELAGGVRTSVVPAAAACAAATRAIGTRKGEQLT